MPSRAEVPGRVGRKAEGYDGLKAGEPVQYGNCAGQPKGWGGRRSELSARTDEPKRWEFEDGNGMPSPADGHWAPDSGRQESP